MNLVFGMLSSVLDFFVDVGYRVDFMGFDLWDISVFVFCVSVIGRWLFPLVFGLEFSGTISAGADTVSSGLRSARRGVSSASASAGRLRRGYNNYRLRHQKL